MGEGKETCVMMLLILTNLLPTIMAEMTTESVPLYSDCRFWVDPATHMRHLRQQMSGRGMSPKVWYWWNTKTGQCTVCRLCSPPEMTAVPCHFLTDTVCIHEDEMSQFLAERQGYYYARPDYHDNEGAGDQEGQEAVMVYNSDTDREAERPDIFGKKQYHRVSHSSDSLTSQIVKKRLNETGQLNKLEKVHSLQSLGSGSLDYGKPTFYSRRGEEVTSNEARDARPVMEVAKVFLGDRLAGSWTSGDKQSRYSNFQNIKQILQGSNSIDQQPDHELDAFKIDTDYKDISLVSPAHYPGERGTPRGAATMSGHHDDWDIEDSVTTVRDSQAVLTPVYGFGIQHLETETSLVTPSGPGDEAIREIVHLLEETGSNRNGNGDKVGHLVMILAGVSAIVIVLVMVLIYLVFGRKGVIISNKFTVLDDQAVVTRGGPGTHSTTHFHEDMLAELAERPREREEGRTVPPAVMRSLRNIRREVVVDIEGRNVVR